MAFNYLITSDDFLAAKGKIEEIKNALDSSYEESNYDLEDDSIYNVIDELSTISLFDNPKFVVLKNSSKLFNLKNDSLKELYKAMNNIDSQNVLILLFLDNVDYKNDVFETLKRYGTLIDVRIKNVAKDQFSINYLNEAGYAIEPDALNLLLTYVDILYSLRVSLDELICYKMEDKKININDIKKMINPPLEDNIYSIIDAVINNDKKRSFECLRDLKLHSVKSSYVISLLINKFQEMYNVSILVKANTNQNDIANIFNVKPGRAYYMIKAAKSSSINQIKRNLDILNQMDYDIKSGKKDENLALELYLLQ